MFLLLDKELEVVNAHGERDSQSLPRASAHIGCLIPRGQLWTHAYKQS